MLGAAGVQPGHAVASRPGRGAAATEQDALPPAGVGVLNGVVVGLGSRAGALRAEPQPAALRADLDRGQRRPQAGAVAGAFGGLAAGGPDDVVVAQGPHAGA